MNISTSFIHVVRLRVFTLSILVLFTGCTVQRLPTRDPDGGMISDSEACLYDYDARGLWYVLFVRDARLIEATHRHTPGFHLFTRDGDTLFRCQCSGRDEVIDIMGETLPLAQGAVLLCDMSEGSPKVEAIVEPLPPIKVGDPESLAKAMYEVSLNARVAAFLSGEAQLRMRAAWEIEKDRKRRKTSGTSIEG